MVAQIEYTIETCYNWTLPRVVSALDLPPLQHLQPGEPGVIHGTHIHVPCEAPVPEGRFEVIVSPTDCVVETEPRHEQATARRMLMPLQKRQVLLLKSSGPMVFDLCSCRKVWADDPAFINRMHSIVPLGRGYFPHDSRHFVPGWPQAGWHRNAHAVRLGDDSRVYQAPASGLMVVRKLAEGKPG